MQTVIIVIHLMVVTAMIGVVLLQKSEGGGLGIGSTGGFLSSRGTSNVLTRTTAILAATFFATSLVLSILAGLDRKPRSIIQNTGTPAQQTPGRTARAGRRGRARHAAPAGATAGGAIGSASAAVAMNGMSGAGKPAPSLWRAMRPANGELRTHIKVSDQTILA